MILRGSYLPPANVVCEGYVFTGVCHSFCSQGGGVRGFIPGGMHGFIRGACVVLFGGACMVLFGGACVVLFGGVCGFIRGVCVVLFGGHAWFYSGGMRGFIGGGMRGFSSFFGYNEIWSMSGRYASYWNAFLFTSGSSIKFFRKANSNVFWTTQTVYVKIYSTSCWLLFFICLNEFCYFHCTEELINA